MAGTMKMPRRIGQPGSVTYYRAVWKLPDGGRDTASKDADGQAFTTKARAKAYADAAEAAAAEAARKAKLKPVPTLREWADRCVEERLMEGGDGSLRNYRDDLKIRILPAFGDVRLDLLDPVEIETWAQRLVDDGSYSVDTLWSTLARFKRLCVLAVKHKEIETTLVPMARRPDAPEAPEVRWMDDTDLAAALAHLPDYLWAPILTLPFTGMRVGEMAAVGPGSTVRHGSLLIDRILVEYENDCDGPGWKPVPKGKRRREAHLPPVVEGAWEEHAARWPAVPVDLALYTWRGRKTEDRTVQELAFTDPHGRPWCRHRIRARWETAQRRAGIKKPRPPHGLRHVLGAILTESGMSAAERGKVLGHAEGSAAIQQYSHLRQTLRQPVVDAVGPLAEAVAKIRDAGPAGPLEPGTFGDGP